MTQCSLEGCNRDPYRISEYCRRHYERFKRYGDPTAGAPNRIPWEQTREEIEWFLSCGIHPAMIATTLKMDPHTIARQCYRHHEPHWGSMFEAA